MNQHITLGSYNYPLWKWVLKVGGGIVFGIAIIAGYVLMLI